MRLDIIESIGSSGSTFRPFLLVFIFEKEWETQLVVVVLNIFCTAVVVVVVIVFFVAIEMSFFTS
jgi:hypothetical protein